MLTKSVMSACVMTLVLGLSACGGSDTRTTINDNETQGKQLLDLQQAYEKGVITESEYHRTKNKILNQ